MVAQVRVEKAPAKYRVQKLDKDGHVTSEHWESTKVRAEVRAQALANGKLKIIYQNQIG